MANPRMIEFEDEGVAFFFPIDLDTLHVERRDLNDPALKDVDFRGKVKRLYFKIFIVAYINDLPDLSRTKFKLRFYYKNTLISQMFPNNPDATGDDLKVWLLDVPKKEWILQDSKHQSLPDPYKGIWNGYHEVLDIGTMPDPVIAWGG